MLRLLDRLEQRLTPAIAGLVAGVLTVDFAATGTTAESVTLNNDGTDIVLSGDVSGATSIPAGDVSKIVVQDSGGSSNQSVALAGTSTFALSGGVSTVGVETVTVNAAVATSGAPASLSSPSHITINNSLTTADGAVSVTADANGDGTGTFTVTNSGSVQAGNAAVTVVGADIDLQGAVSTATTAVVRPSAANRSMNLGTNVAGSLSLTDTELDLISASSITLGADNSPSYPGLGAGTITVSAKMLHAGDAHISVVTARNIVQSASAGWTSVAGNLLFRANQQTTATTGSFVGINVLGGSIASTSGDITLVGRGGTASVNYQVGVRLTGNSTVGLGTSGAVTLSGTGGATNNTDNYGVYLTGGTVTSGGGPVSVTGKGGGLSVSRYNFGVCLDNLGGTSLITGSGSALVNVTGTGGNGSGGDHLGVAMSFAKITSSGGDVVVAGQGGGSGAASYNFGVSIVGTSQILAGGMGTTKVIGTGANTFNPNNPGVVVDNKSLISSSGGPVIVIGKGIGGNGNNDGVRVSNATITAGGMGMVTVDGVGTGAAFSHGINVNNLGSITSSGGPVFLTGAGSGLSSAAGVNVGGSSTITSGGTAALDIAVEGSLVVDASTAVVRAGAIGNSTLTLRPKASTNFLLSGASQSAINRFFASTIVFGADGSSAYPGAPVTTFTLGAGSLQHAGDANIVLVSGRSVLFDTGASWTTTSANITVLANQQAMPTSGNFVGIDLNNAKITSGAGLITLMGRGGDDSTGGQVGVLLRNASTVGLGMGGGGNTVTVQGTGGGGSGSGNHGILVMNNSSLITSGGTLSVNAIAGNAGSHGLRLDLGGKLAPTGVGSIYATVNGSTDLLFGDIISGGNITLNTAETITQTAGLIQAAGAFTVGTSGAIATFNSAGNKAGQLIVPGGVTCFVNGAFDPAGSVQVTGLLGGTGSVGTLSVLGSGKVAPGASPGKLATGNVSFNSSSVFAVELNGATAGAGYDQLVVNGTVDLGGATLSATRGFTPAPGQVFTIIDNDGSDTITTTFAGYGDGSKVAIGGIDFVISYKGGDGNDVTLTAPAGAPTASVAVDSGSGQRSMVQSLVVAFSEPVVFVGAATAAFTLQRVIASTNPTPNGAVAIDVLPAAGPASSFTITFNDATFAPTIGAVKSLIDGKYALALNAGQIKSAATGTFLDGNGDGTAGDDQSVAFHRLFGDANGDGFTDNVDFIAFRTANGSDSTMVNYNPAFDSNADGFIDIVDLLAFRQRLGVQP